MRFPVPDDVGTWTCYVLITGEAGVGYGTCVQVVSQVRRHRQILRSPLPADTLAAAPLRVGQALVEIERSCIRLTTRSANGGIVVFHVDELGFKGTNAPSGHAFELADGAVTTTMLNHGPTGVAHEPRP